MNYSSFKGFETINSDGFVCFPSHPKGRPLIATDITIGHILLGWQVIDKLDVLVPNTYTEWSQSWRVKFARMNFNHSGMRLDLETIPEKKQSMDFFIRKDRNVVIQASVDQLTEPVLSNYPHTCIFCGRPAYIGLNEVQHANGATQCQK
jgi:hypothetical protein